VPYEVSHEKGVRPGVIRYDPDKNACFRRRRA
jgi:hypothetical protein